jgi:3-oxoacyl-[acyl-carrier protein] reductase
MDLGLQRRTALVTGASKGIGRAAAAMLASEGCDVWMVSRTASDLGAAADAIRSEHGVKVTPIAADLSRTEEIDRVWAEVGVPDILVNNAGAIPSGTIADIDDERWRQAWDLKVFGYVTLMRHALAAMGERGSGVIVNVIGAGGERPTPGYIAGGGGNAALMAMTRALGSTSLRHGVRVVGINPGLIHTERLEELMRTGAERRFGDPDRWQELLDQRHPPGHVDHIAAAVAFLASDRSGNTTGTILTIDGGSSAR